MAETFYLRPSADISIGHKLIPEDATAAYLLLNEEVSDGSSTYITHDLDSRDESTWSKPSTFIFSGDSIPSGYKIKSAKLVITGTTNLSSGQTTDVINERVEFTVKASGVNLGTVILSNWNGRFGSSASSGTGAPVGTVDITNILDKISVPNSIEVTVTSACDKITEQTASSSDGKTTASYISSHRYSTIWIEIECESGLNIYHKAGGTWKQAQAAYQKKSGAWVEITEEECKTILQSNFITS